MEGPGKVRSYTNKQRTLIGLAVGAGASLLLSFVVNHTYMYAGELTGGGLLSRILSGMAFRSDMGDMFPQRFFDVMQTHGRALQGTVVFFLLAFCLFPFLFSYFGGRFGARALGGIALGYLLLSLVAVVPQLAASAGVISVVAAIAGAWAVRRNDDDFFGLALCCGSLLISMLLAFSLFSLFSGRDIFSLFSGTLAQMLGDMLSRVSQATVFADYYLPYYTPAEGQEFFRGLFLSLFLCIALLVGVLDFLLSRGGAKSDGALTVKATLFRSWRLPNSFVIGMLVLCIFGELGKQGGWPHFDTVTSCFFIIFAFALMLQGLAALLFMGLQMHSFWPFLIAVVLSLRSGPSIFVFVGLFEQFFNLRTRLQIMALASFLAAQDRRHGRQNGWDDGAGGEDVGDMIGRMGEMDAKELETLQQEFMEQEKREKERREAQEKKNDDRK